MIHENLQHLHRALALGLAARTRVSGKEALEWATACIEVLQEELGGDRLGSKGVYVPAPNYRLKRNDRIREMMGPPPFSRQRAKLVATKEHCSERTVWRALETEQEMGLS